MTIDESSAVDALDAVESMAADLVLETLYLTKFVRWRMLLMKIWLLFSDIIPYDLVE